MEEVDDFLLEPGSMQYIENARFPKKDVAEKVRPFGQGVVTGSAGFTADALAIWSDNDKRAAVVSPRRVSHTDDAGVTWGTDTKTMDLLGIKRICSSQEQQGFHSFTWAPMGIVNGIFFTPSTALCAFERVEKVSRRNQRQVVVQTYNMTTGELIDERLHENAHSPRVHSLGGVGGQAVYGFVQNGNLLYYGLGVSGDLQSATLAGNFSFDVEDRNGYIDNDDGLLDAQNYGDLRFGWNFTMTNYNGQHVSYHDIKTGRGCTAFKDGGSPFEAVRITFHGATGVPSGGTFAVAFDFIGSRNSVLDCCVDTTGTYAYVLVGRISDSENEWDTKLYQVRLSDGNVRGDYTVGSQGQRVPVNGSVRCSSGSVWCAVTYAYDYPTDTMINGGAHRIVWDRVDDQTDWSTSPPTSSDAQEFIFNHRLCSNIVIDKDNRAYCVVQQWSNWNPGITDLGAVPANPDVPTPTITGNKPVTSILIRLDVDTDIHNSVVATFDAAQSKAVPFPSDEQSVHKGGELYYFSNGAPGNNGYHQFFYGNSVAYTVWDAAYYLSTSAADAYVSTSDPKDEWRRLLALGSGAFRVYQVENDIPTYWANFPDGAIAGASVPIWYDARGRNVMSGGMLDSPEIVKITRVGGNGATYNAYADTGEGSETPKAYTAVWKFTDTAGRVHRSAPATPVFVGKLEAADTTTEEITVIVTPPIMLQRERGTLYLEIYESFQGGPFQLAATDIKNFFDASLVTAQEVVVNVSGTSVRDIYNYREAPQLYTEGDVLAADPWPNFDYVVQSGRRMFAHSIADPSTVYYSKVFEPNVAPEFSAALTITLGNNEITALGTIDDKTLCFTEDGIWVIYGTGPDNTGANGDFFVEKLTHTVGCEDQRSVQNIKDGVFFYSSTTGEFHLLTRDMNLVDIGAGVRDISRRITNVDASVVDPSAHEVRWWVQLDPAVPFLPIGQTVDVPAQPPRPFLENLTDNEGSLVYNYRHQKWSFHELGSPGETLGGGALILDNKVSIISTSWVNYVESDTEWRWSNRMKWETPWLRVNQLQDFGRFYEATILGKYLSSWTDTGNGIEAGDLWVTVKYDYEGADADTDTYVFKANQDFNPVEGDRLQLRVRPKRQKCQAVKFIIEERATTAIEVWEPTYTNGRGFQLTAIDLLYGSKGGSGSKNLGSRRRKG